jgi:hypothetical protein
VSRETGASARSDEASRVRLAAGTETDPDVLIDLATDSSVTVRAAVALNGAAPGRVNGLLAKDSDERVRILLARKLTALVPGLSQAERAQLYQETWDTLNMLVADEATRVRAVIADAVKELPDVPRELIRQLARDVDLSVYEPVVRLSPLLTTEDLLALVTKPPAAGTVLAVARRAQLEPAVSDAIAGTADTAAIRALLDNPLAQIREATLDALVARSRTVQSGTRRWFGVRHCRRVPPRCCPKSFQHICWRSLPRASICLRRLRRNCDSASLCG